MVRIPLKLQALGNRQHWSGVRQPAALPPQPPVQPPQREWRARDQGGQLVEVPLVQFPLLVPSARGQDGYQHVKRVRDWPPLAGELASDHVVLTARTAASRPFKLLLCHHALIAICRCRWAQTTAPFAASRSPAWWASWPASWTRRRRARRLPTMGWPGRRCCWWAPVDSGCISDCEARPHRRMHYYCPCNWCPICS